MHQMRRLMSVMEAEETGHPFEMAGLGLAPFKCVGAYSLPSPSLAEANPQAYNNALQEMPRDYGVGTCAYCGMSLVHNFLINSSDSRKFVVGSECVAKTGDKGLSDAVKVKAARIRHDARRAKVQARREIDRQKWMTDNADRLAAEKLEREAKEAVIQAQRSQMQMKWKFMLPHLQGDSPFISSMRDSIESGEEPRGRAVTILGEIYAKDHGRRGSKGYYDALDRFAELIG